MKELKLRRTLYFKIVNMQTANKFKTKDFKLFRVTSLSRYLKICSQRA